MRDAFSAPALYTSGMPNNADTTPNIRAIDLNADMGEYASDEARANEAALMSLVTSCSIACGGHAGDEASMRATALLAADNAVAIGAHPSYPDREGFGRRSIDINHSELRSALSAQIAQLNDILDSECLTLRSVKPHGALYNDAAKDIALARLVIDAAGDVVIVGPPGSALEAAALEADRKFAGEGFVDRLYLASGALAPRSMPGAVIDAAEARAAQAEALAKGEAFAVHDGVVRIAAQTLCIHSDSPGAVATAKAVRERLNARGFIVRAFA